MLVSSLGEFLKFQQISAFEQHIEVNLSSKVPSKSYVILHSQKEERRKILEKISTKISSYNKAEITFLEGKEWNHVNHVLSAPSLFGDVEIVVWDGVKSLSDDVIDKLLRYIINPAPWAFLVIGADSFKSFSSLYTKVSKELVILDLTEEKPWDREKRQQQEI